MKKLQSRNKKKGGKFEGKVQRTIGSGNVWFSPLDLSYEKYAVEAKYTDMKGYRISTQLLEKIWDKALSMNKEPILVIGIKRNDEQVFVLQCNINVERSS
jgi:hypothetical protein